MVYNILDHKRVRILMKTVLAALLLQLLLLGTSCKDRLDASSRSAAGPEIGVVEQENIISVDTGAGLVYTIHRANGDMLSCRLHGRELSSREKHSQIEMGLGKARVEYRLVDGGRTVIVSAETDTLTHYYISRAGENIIYMATYITAEPTIGELRFIFRGNGKILTQVPAASNNAGSVRKVEHKEMNGAADGTTTSKYYENDQAKNLTIRGDTGDGVGVFMAYGNREKSSGGPFFRDIQFQSGGSSEIYNYMNSGHAQTEGFRMGLHGPYALVFTDGTEAAVPDFSWMADLGLKGWISERGQVTIHGMTGMDSGYAYTVGFANAGAQYWTAAAPGGFAECKNMIPGLYTMTIYKGELAVYTQKVNVSAQQNIVVECCDISDDPGHAAALWRIGDWDGTPLEFLNGRNLCQMHPSDSRNESFDIGSFDAASPSGYFPALQLRRVNSPLTIRFWLTEVQAASSHCLRIGITAAYNGGRPRAEINGRVLALPEPSSQPKSRSLTIGTYRGNNHVFAWQIPAAAFKTGQNVLAITPISGMQDLTPWLSAGWAYDCIDLGIN